MLFLTKELPQHSIRIRHTHTEFDRNTRPSGTVNKHWLILRESTQNTRTRRRRAVRALLRSPSSLPTFERSLAGQLLIRLPWTLLPRNKRRSCNYLSRNSTLALAPLSLSPRTGCLFHAVGVPTTNTFSRLFFGSAMRTLRRRLVDVLGARSECVKVLQPRRGRSACRSFVGVALLLLALSPHRLSIAWSSTG